MLSCVDPPPIKPRDTAVRQSIGQLRFPIAFLKVCKLTFLKDVIYFLEKRRDGETRERNINVWLPLECPLLGT